MQRLLEPSMFALLNIIVEYKSLFRFGNYYQLSSAIVAFCTLRLNNFHLFVVTEFI